MGAKKECALTKGKSRKKPESKAAGKKRARAADEDDEDDEAGDQPLKQRARTEFVEMESEWRDWVEDRMLVLEGKLDWIIKNVKRARVAAEAVEQRMEDEEKEKKTEGDKGTGKSEKSGETEKRSEETEGTEKLGKSGETEDVEMV